MRKEVIVSHVVELDDRAVRECFTTYLESLAGTGCYIDDKGVVWREDEYRHGTPTSSVVPKPSEVQVLALKLSVALDTAAAKARKGESK